MENHGDVRKYRRTEVQRYSSTVVQIHVAIERMVAVGFRKRDPSSGVYIMENTPPPLGGGKKYQPMSFGEKI
jgi:hypothetical protein